PGSMSCEAPLGRFTFTPSRDAVSTITDELTMKMMSSTRKMSVSGVMLISAKIPPAPASSSGSLPSAILGLRVVGQLAQRLEELVHQQLDVDRDAGEPLVEEVVEDDGLDGDGDAGGGGDERLGDALRHDGEPAAAALGDGAERVHDADDGAVEADERRGRADRAEDPQAHLHVEGDALTLAIDGGLERVARRAPVAFEADEEH